MKGKKQLAQHITCNCIIKHGKFYGNFVQIPRKTSVKVLFFLMYIPGKHWKKLLRKIANVN